MPKQTEMKITTYSLAEMLDAEKLGASSALLFVRRSGDTALCHVDGMSASSKRFVSVPFQEYSAIGSPQYFTVGDFLEQFPYHASNSEIARGKNGIMTVPDFVRRCKNYWQYELNVSYIGKEYFLFFASSMNTVMLNEKGRGKPKIILSKPAAEAVHGQELDESSSLLADDVVKYYLKHREEEDRRIRPILDTL